MFAKNPIHDPGITAPNQRRGVNDRIPFKLARCPFKITTSESLIFKKA
jgi:hypothetical protein